MLSLYSDTYVQSLLLKFKNRSTNHWNNRISLAKKLVSQHAPRPPATLLDLGCAIGTFALEFAMDGYQTIGLDFDEKALTEGEKLAKELGCDVKWICADASDFTLKQQVDIVVSLDLLEHLTDDIILKCLDCVQKNLKPGGVFIFHTFPTQYNHIFYSHPLTCFPLIPFRNLPEQALERLVQKYAKFLDKVYYKPRFGKTYQEIIDHTVHPNPLSYNRLKKFLQDAGFKISFIEVGLDTISPLKPGQGKLAKQFFSHQSVAQRSLWGVATKQE